MGTPCSSREWGTRSPANDLAWSLVGPTCRSPWTRGGVAAARLYLQAATLVEASAGRAFTVNRICRAWRAFLQLNLHLFGSLIIVEFISHDPDVFEHRIYNKGTLSILFNQEFI